MSGAHPAPGAGADVYARLGVRPVVNAAATLTAIGGSLMAPEVLAAMAEAASTHVDMHELHAAAGRRIAELTRNEAAHVTGGCAAAIVLSVLGCITKGDPHVIGRMPDGDGLPTDVIVHCAHRIPYDPAIRLAGARIVQIGNALQTFDWELEAAITERTAAVLYVAGSHLGTAALDLDTTVRIAHAHGVPVIVDAAAQLPPYTNLWDFTVNHGADLALFSGGKALRGPQSSGFMVGRADLVAAAAANASPYQRLARALKVGKEEIVGLVRALELYLDRDVDADRARWERVVARWLADLDGIPGLRAGRCFPNEAGQPVPRVRLDVDPAVLGGTASDLADLLWDGTPRVMVGRAGRDAFHLTPDTLGDDEAELVTQRLTAAARQVAAGAARAVLA
jgi:D-glucosaminate-6-phosphate ammonia-lyase